MDRRAAVTAPGAANALFARAIEESGFEVIYVTGAGIANMHLGQPDIGLTSLSDLVYAVSSIADVVDLPLIVDADTGFGNALNMYQTVRKLERAGASALQVEDQIFPKRCGHFDGKDVVPVDEMLGKIKAATDARQDDNLLVIARTDARAVLGLDAAIERAWAYGEAGADLTFVEAPVDAREMAEITRRLAKPQVANIVFGGRTPDPGRDHLAEMGFSLVLYANATLQAALHATYETLWALRDHGSLDPVADRLSSFDERQRTVRKPHWDSLEKRYALVAGAGRD
ncbi:isocitrate lyase/PEP mutase family protein [Devosia sp. YIM 151766]|uniref:isocitrate lyase/PEP mutase family protein n=1 Tax=Devosia sp. YIM 151766 TaxID=3017325 RepID=UPI00255D1558|nr:isocitrate lyase/PEP mutase family protein [Devosia sp. YIM 151766]WIY53175.1 isocitrate lyase/PEP mutase family protein [Devosia sp. YIM 151766]